MVVTVCDEQVNLDFFLERVMRFAEIVVIDSASTGHARNIACVLGAGAISYELDGRYPGMSNWFLMSNPSSQLRRFC
jgi:hypothetical protein